ncbi:DUF927 domain-containing protein [Azohydromonas sp.]|uniref:DUF927 domain-containing protein n=1 Tax=Azohydromonas sp. TaxID=1872666 RepID=UPI002C224061|nr:DUF927 domain-containing protein [Azohydromonas sp.]HMM85074.1 DUF927 domain-containing protein [Azohydromonas sp.]
MQSTPTPSPAHAVDRAGWHSRAFVLPRETLQREPAEGEPEPEAIVFQSGGAVESPFKVRGTLDAWRSTVAAKSAGNSRLTFAVSCAFAGPLLAGATEANHGHAGREWLRWCVDHADELRDDVRGGIERLAAQWVADGASGQVHRVGRRFALAAVAGELATDAGLTGWPQGEATAAARACFEAWLAARPEGVQ